MEVDLVLRGLTGQMATWVMRELPSRVGLLALGVSSTIPLVGNRPGIGITYDSTEYFAGAASMVESLRFSAVDGASQATWPPGYSVLLAIPHALGLTLANAAIIVNVLAVAVLAWSFRRVATQLGAGPLTVVGAAAFLFLLTPVMDAGTLALSELPFLAVLVTMIAVALRPATVRTAAMIGVLGALVYALRYVGLFFLPFVLVTALFSHRSGTPLRTRLGHALISAIVAVIPIIAWTARNIEMSGTPTGNREPGGGTLTDALVSGVTVMGQWVTRQRETPGTTVTTTTVIGFIIAIALVAIAVRHAIQRRMVPALIASLPIVFLVFNAYRYVNVEYAPIDQRTTIPAFAVTILAFATARLRPIRGMPRLATPAAMVAAALLTFGFAIRDAQRFTQDARAWGSSSFQESPLALRAKAVANGSLFISNFPQRAFALVERAPIRNQYQFDLPQVTECSRRYVLWFAEAPFQGNEPTGGTVLYADAEGSLREIGDCSTPPKTYWE